MSVKQKLILAGISEIEHYGINNFSLRNIAKRCGVSCAAPYKHFKAKKDFLVSVLKYINEVWHKRQEKIFEQYKGDSKRIVYESCIEYINFLVEQPNFLYILSSVNNDKNKEFSELRKMLNYDLKNLVHDYCVDKKMDKTTETEKTVVVRALIYGGASIIGNSEEKIRQIAQSVISEKIKDEIYSIQ